MSFFEIVLRVGVAWVALNAAAISFLVAAIAAQHVHIVRECRRAAREGLVASATPQSQR